MVEDAFEGGADEEGVSDFSDEGEGDFVSDAVEEGDAGVVGGFGDLVVVIPEFVGADALVIDEGVAGADVFDFGEPGASAEERDADAVFDEEAIGHFLGEIGDDFEVEIIWGDTVEVGGGFDEIPGFSEGGGEGLGAFDPIHGVGGWLYETERTRGVGWI